MNFLYRFFRSRISVSVHVADNFVILIEKRVVYAPGIDADRHRDFSDFFTLFKSVDYVFEKFAVIPDEMSVFFVHSVFETVNFFEFKFSVFDVRKNVSAARRADIYCKKIFFHNLLQVAPPLRIISII